MHCLWVQRLMRLHTSAGLPGHNTNCKGLCRCGSRARALAAARAARCGRAHDHRAARSEHGWPVIPAG